MPPSPQGSDGREERAPEWGSADPEPLCGLATTGKQQKVEKPNVYVYV